jgi:hypothetical protein
VNSVSVDGHRRNQEKGGWEGTRAKGWEKPTSMKAEFFIFFLHPLLSQWCTKDHAICCWSDTYRRNVYDGYYIHA